MLRKLDVAAALVAVFVSAVSALILDEWIPPPALARGLGAGLFMATAAAVVLTILSRLRRGEARRKALERRFERLASNMGEVLWIVDPRKRRLVYVNPAYRRTWTWDESPDELGVRSFLDAVHPDDRHHFLRIFDVEAAGRASSGEFTYRRRRPDGGLWHWEWLRHTEIPDPELGRPLVAGISSDITSRMEAMVALKQGHDELERQIGERTAELTLANQQLRREVAERDAAVSALGASRTRYRTLLENSFELLSELDGSFRFVDMNARFGRALGYEREDLLGEAAESVVHPEDRPRIRELMRERLARGHPASDVNRVVDRDGAVHYFEWTAVPIPDATETRYLICSRDVTGRLREESRFRALFEASPDALIAVDAEGRIRLFNAQAERVFGRARSDVLGEPVEVLVPERYREGHVRERRAFSRQPTSRRMGGDGREITGLRSDGSEFPVEISLARIADPDDEGDLLVVASARDVTARVRAEEEGRALEEQVRRAQKLESLGVLAGGIAHDFNNLLAAIVNYANLALRRADASDRAREPLLEIKSVAHRMSELANQMLAYAGRGSGTIEAVDLSAEVGRIRALLAASISKKAVVKEELGFGLPPTRGEASQIRQVVMNLITNASDALADAPGTISLRTGLLQGGDSEVLRGLDIAGVLPPLPCLYLEVQDTGVGMDEDTRARVFEPFFTNKREGRGLGMAAVRGIVRRCGGAIGIESAPGRGSRFAVFFPTAAAEEAPGPSKAEAVEDAPGPLTILLVDDESSVREPARQLLEERGMRVVTCESGEQAVEWFEANVDEADVAVLDLTMPGLGGIEVLRKLRAFRPDLAVVLSSGFSKMELGDACEGDALTAFVRKPYEMDELLASIEQIGASRASSPTRGSRA